MTIKKRGEKQNREKKYRREKDTERAVSGVVCDAERKRKEKMVERNREREREQ